MLDSSNRITELLVKWRAGDEEALETLVPVVYNELRRLAHHYLQRERAGHTLQSAAPVHEAYIRLNRQEHPTSQTAHISLPFRRN